MHTLFPSPDFHSLIRLPPQSTRYFSVHFRNGIQATILPIHQPPSGKSENNKTSTHLRVAYQGIPGVFSEEAARKAYPNCNTIPCNHFKDALHAVEIGIADFAILPLENSITGSIYGNHDFLLRYELHITGEVLLPIHHRLLVLPGVGKESVTKIISDSQGFKQCDRTIAKLGLKNAARKAVENTAAAAEYIAINNRRDTAAIASARSAEIYGLEVISDQIQDDSRNVTRFVVLGREPVDLQILDLDLDRAAVKTSIVLGQDIRKGRSKLVEVMSVFELRQMKLTKIELRPDPKWRIEEGDLRKATAMEV